MTASKRRLIQQPVKQQATGSNLNASLSKGTTGAEDNRRAAIWCPTLSKFGEKGISLGFNSRLEKITSSFAQKASQRVNNYISTGEINDGSVVHGGASSMVGWMFGNAIPTRCAADIQTARTPASIIAHAEMGDLRNKDAAMNLEGV